MGCPECGFPSDDANESQPGCPTCGASPFSASEDDGALESWDPDEGAYGVEPPSPRRGDLAALMAQYRSNRSGLYQATVLQDVCLDCGSQQVLRQGGRRQCLHPACRAQWYVSHCRQQQCRTDGRRTPIDSRDAGTSRCSHCGWHKCPACFSCEQQCPCSGQAQS